MALETAQHIFQLNPSYPSATDRVRDGDDHIRVLKAVLKSDLGSLKGPLTVTAEFLNGLSGLLVPMGAIIQWFGQESTIPAGYALCDGREVDRSDKAGKITTPDLRGRVPYGANADHPVGATFGQTSKTVTTEAAGGHTPSGKASIPGFAAQNVTINGSTGSSQTGVSVNPASVGKVDAGGSANNVPRAPLTTTDPGHTHTFSGSASIEGRAAQDVQLQMEAVAGHGHSVSVNVEQPAFALHFIMRI